jgi:hypothetical protein
VRRVCTRQCTACPFRSTSAPGWLGDYTPHEVVNHAWHGRPFYCHSRTDYTDARWQERAARTGVLCRGYLLFRHRMLAPENEDQDLREAEAQAVADAESDAGSVDVLEGLAFVAHHSMPADARGGHSMQPLTG